MISDCQTCSLLMGHTVLVAFHEEIYVICFDTLKCSDY